MDEQKLHALFNTLERDRHDARPLEAFVADAFESLKHDLRLLALRLYVERREGFELRMQIGEDGAAAAEAVNPSCPALLHVLRHRVYLFADPEHRESPGAAGILPSGPAAGLVVGRRPHRRALFLLLGPDWARRRLDFALNILRGALALHLQEERLSLSLEQTAEIQQSLLDEGPPSFPGFEIACRSVQAEKIGGDFFDFVRFGSEVLGLAVGDASGHGLPAALLVRDVVTGLRMGLEKHLRMEYVFAKLNRVIHRANPTSRYVSVFYAELESNGNLSYVNAGHQPPLLFRRDRVLELRMGGTVIGPFPEVSYRRGVLSLEPGGVLVVLTDGIVERPAPSGDFFGEERLRRIVRDHHAESAQELLDRVFEEARIFGAGRPWDDDVTLMVIRRQEEVA